MIELVPSAARAGSISLADSFERYLQDKGKGRGGDGGNYRRNAARELERFGRWAAGDCGRSEWMGVDLRVSASSFSTFDAGTGTLGVDVGWVRDVLSIGDADELAQFALDAANSTLEINIDGITRTIELDPVESLRYPVEIPDIDIPATVHLSPDDISLGLDAADLLADRFDLTVDSESREVQFAADGDTDSMTYRWEDTDLIAFEPADVEVKLDSSLVKSANAGLPDGTNRVLHIGDSVPLVLKSEFPDANGAMQFVIAPKLPN